MHCLFGIMLTFAIFSPPSSAVPYGDAFGDYTVVVSIEIDNRRDHPLLIEKTFARLGVIEHQRLGGVFLLPIY